MWQKVRCPSNPLIFQNIFLQPIYNILASLYSEQECLWLQTSVGMLPLYEVAQYTAYWGERGGSVVECRTPEREVGGSIPTAAVLCPWARHFTPRKYWLITQEAVAPSRHDWKIVDWDVKPQHKQNKNKTVYRAVKPQTKSSNKSKFLCALAWP